MPQWNGAISFRCSDRSDLHAVADLYARETGVVPRLFRRVGETLQSCIAVSDSGAVVGHVGGWSHATRWRGSRGHALEQVPPVVSRCLDEARRAEVTRGLAAFWQRQFCGVDKNVVVWDPQPTRADGEDSDSETLAKLPVLVCSDATRFGMRRPRLSVARRARMPADIDDAARRIEAEVSFGVVRDATYLSWRYGSIDRRYDWFTARNPITGALRGAAVVRIGGHASGGVTIMEWLVPTGDFEACTALLHGLARFVRQRRLSGIAASLPRWSPHFPWFQSVGFREESTQLELAGQSFDSATNVAELRGCWYASFGDVASY